MAFGSSFKRARWSTLLATERTSLTFRRHRWSVEIRETARIFLRHFLRPLPASVLPPPPSSWKATWPHTSAQTSGTWSTARAATSVPLARDRTERFRLTFRGRLASTRFLLLRRVFVSATPTWLRTRLKFWSTTFVETRRCPVTWIRRRRNDAERGTSTIRPSTTFAFATQFWRLQVRCLFELKAQIS